MEENHSGVHGAQGTNGNDLHPTVLDIDKLGCFLSRQIWDSTPFKIVDTSSTVAVGGISTNTHRVTASCVLRSGKMRKYSIIVKTPMQWKTDAQTAKFDLVFRTEIRAYIVVLPAMETLMDEFDDKRDTLWPTLYGIECDLIAMEDLAESQYRLRDRKKNLDLPHAILALRGMARSHALSMELLRRGWIGESERGRWKSPDDKPLCQLLKALTVSLSNAMINDWGEEWKPIAMKLMTHKDDVAVKYYKDVPHYDKRFEVLNHGDLNIQNMMFKYTEYGDHPVTVKFFDFQYIHLNSFIWDLSFLLNVSVDPAVRRDNLALFFKHYVESLEENLKFLNYIGHIPTLDDVEAEWRRISYAHMCHLWFNITRSAETEHPFNYGEIMNDSPEDVVDKSVFSDGKVKRNLGDDFKYFYANGIM